MAKIETAAVSAAGRGGGSGSLYAYRVRGLGRSGVVLWIGGRDDEPDRVLALPDADRRQVPVFMTVRQARVYVRRRGRRLATSEADTLELVRVQHWLEDPMRRRVPSGALLDAWNFFEDLARGLGEVHGLPRQSAVHNSAYEKLFGGECSAWTLEEQRAVLELITAGVELWNSCPVIVKPRSRIALDSGRGVHRGC
ncbi:hypothetical protein [Streptomyces gibsoniae]|uniref:Uncharacterized protein n=1 Tax=Streptomyces gibsoniae TaxID=3075529 RepID=A0ABU2U0F6_9ACTN|nr:hypothetical protein [Streptomyces sp. DSM 41699]MDT0466663.1 hypothetical protein [Streptomyces sp. DSM 41699]